MRRFLVTCILLIGVLNAKASGINDSLDFLIHQVQRLKNDPVIRNGRFHHEKIKVPLRWEKNDQFLVKSATDCYLFIPGTGILFQYGSDSNQFIRIDSTDYFGYNFESFPFSYKGKIFNLGGIGYWRVNGQLRTFNNLTHEWDIVPLNKEVPIHYDNSSTLWYDKSAGKIYVAAYEQYNAATKDKSNRWLFQAMVLDLSSNDWSELGTTINDVQNLIGSTDVFTINLPFGLLVINNSTLQILLLDYKNNSIKNLKPQSNKAQYLFATMNDGHFYYTDSSLVSVHDQHIDSVILTDRDFISAGKHIFTPIDNSLFKSDMILRLRYFLAIPLIISIVLFSRYQKRKSLSEKPIQQAIESTVHNELTSDVVNSNFKDNFSGLEWMLIEVMLNNFESGKKTTLDEIHQVLGLERKSADTQKQQRFKHISAINQKYQAITQRQLIVREPYIHDKRSFYYIIEAQDVEFIRGQVNP